MKMAMNASSTSQLETADDLDKDEYFYSIKKRIYQSAKEGYALNLQVVISKVESIEIRNVLVNQVSEIRAKKLKIEDFPHTSTPRHSLFPRKRSPKRGCLIGSALRKLKVIGRA